MSSAELFPGMLSVKNPTLGVAISCFKNVIYMDTHNNAHFQTKKVFMA